MRLQNKNADIEGVPLKRQEDRCTFAPERDIVVNVDAASTCQAQSASTIRR